MVKLNNTLVHLYFSPNKVRLGMSVNVHGFVSFPQTLYTHIVTDIKNINAKHKNNKVNVVSTLLFSMFAALYCSIVEYIKPSFSTFPSGIAEFHVYHVKR